MKVNGMDYNWKTYQSYSDEGHGWLRVSYTALYRLGLLRFISSYSYQYGNWVYLEEDRDATIFLRTLRFHGIRYRINHHNSTVRSHIRSYRSYYCGSVYDNDKFYLSLESNARLPIEPYI